MESKSGCRTAKITFRFGLQINNFFLEIREMYMVAAATILKSSYLKLFHVTCVELCYENKISLLTRWSTYWKINPAKKKPTRNISCYWIPTQACRNHTEKLDKCCLVLCKVFIGCDCCIVSEKKKNLQRPGFTVQLLTLRTNTNVWLGLCKWLNIPSAP